MYKYETLILQNNTITSVFNTPIYYSGESNYITMNKGMSDGGNRIRCLHSSSELFELIDFRFI